MFLQRKGFLNKNCIMATPPAERPAQTQHHKVACQCRRNSSSWHASEDAAPADMPMIMGESHPTPPLDEELKAIKCC